MWPSSGGPVANQLITEKDLVALLLPWRWQRMHGFLNTVLEGDAALLTHGWSPPLDVADIVLLL